MASTERNGMRRLDRVVSCGRAAGFAVIIVALASSVAFAGYQVEVVLKTDLVLGTSLEYSGDGNPTIAYGDRTAGQVRLATKSGSTWGIETVDSRLPNRLDHAIDTNGNILVCYTAPDGGGWSVYAAQRTGSTWSTSRVARNMNSTPVSCAYDATHVASVVYADSTRLHFAKRSGSSWTSEVVASKVKVLVELSLAFDAGKPAIAFVDDQRSKTGQAYVKLATKSGSRWSIETAASGGSELPRNASLAFAPVSGPMISYNLVITKASFLATKSAGMWNAPEFIAAGYSGALRVDAGDNPHVGIDDASPNVRIFVASRSGGVWFQETVEWGPAEDSYALPSTALDPSGHPALSYNCDTSDPGISDLRFASWVP